jgi:hypothetical protein
MSRVVDLNDLLLKAKCLSVIDIRCSPGAGQNNDLADALVRLDGTLLLAVLTNSPIDTVAACKRIV